MSREVLDDEPSKRRGILNHCMDHEVVSASQEEHLDDLRQHTRLVRERLYIRLPGPRAQGHTNKSLKLQTERVLIDDGFVSPDHTTCLKRPKPGMSGGLCHAAPRSEFIVRDPSASLNNIEDSLIEIIQDDRTPKIFRPCSQISTTIEIKLPT